MVQHGLVAKTTAYRVFDSYGEHVYTVYTEDEARQLVAKNDGWTYSVAQIRGPQW